MNNEDANNEDANIEQVEQRWFIGLDWYQQSNRSFPALAHSCLCPKCQEKLDKENSAEALLNNIKNCCAKTSGFISAGLPIVESIFRLFLANGNQPLDLGELGRLLRERCGGDAYRTSVEVLSRLLQSDQYYGLTQVTD